MDFSEGVRKVFLAGVGAIAVTGEKSKKVIEELVKKGEITVDEGKTLNEELKRKMDEKCKDTKAENAAHDFHEAVSQIERLSKEERDVLRAKLDKADAAEKADTKEERAAKKDADPEEEKKAEEDKKTDGDESSK